MSDSRTLIDKMVAMATQDESPHERDNARRMLAEKGLWPIETRTDRGESLRPWRITWRLADLVDGITTAELITAAERACRRQGHVPTASWVIKSYETVGNPERMVEVSCLIRADGSAEPIFGDAQKAARDFDAEMDEWSRRVTVDSATTKRMSEALRRAAEESIRVARAHAVEESPGTVSRTSFVHTAGSGSFVGKRRR